MPVVPPSPSTAPGIRIWPEPIFTHWPAIAYGDESRNIAFSLPVRVPGVGGTIGWTDHGDAAPLSYTLPTGTDSISGLLPLPMSVGTHAASVVIDGKITSLSLRIADAREPWPLAGLSNGFPSDEHGVPVVLLDRRRDPKDERTWTFLDGMSKRPNGRALIVGDPMESMGETAWKGLDAELRPACDGRYPQHAVLVALAKLPDPLPRTIIWCPGNDVLHGGAWSAEEERVLGVIRTRCEHLGFMPRLVLALPPLSVDEHLREQSGERRDVLVRSASALSWIVVDLARAAGNPGTANRIGDRTFTRYPQGDAQERMRAALREALIP